jgi:hypothetical protein
MHGFLHHASKKVAIVIAAAPIFRAHNFVKPDLDKIPLLSTPLCLIL